MINMIFLSNDAGAPARRKRVLEIAAVVIISFMIVGLLVTLKSLKINEMEGDTAIFYQLAENIASRGQPVSQVFANTQAFLESGLLTMPADKLAKDPLLPPPAAERNEISFHAYLILYPIGALVKIFPTSLVFMSLWVLSFVGVVALAYLALRGRNISIPAALLFCLLIVTHPAWSDGLLSGQFYPDRLFVFFGFAFMLLASRNEKNRGMLLTAGIVCALINERGAITAGIFLLAYQLLFWKQSIIDRYFKLALAAGLLLYGTVIVKLFVSNAYYSTFLPPSAGAAIDLFRDPVFAQKAELFLLVNVAFLIVALFNVRAAVIAAVLMMPNLLGNIGGAEKIGWVTHYHSYYLPGLIWAALLGYQTAYFKATTRQLRAGFYAVACGLILFVSFVDPYTPAPLSISPSNVWNQFFFKTKVQMAQWFTPSGRSFYHIKDDIARDVPQGSVISTTEQLMAFLYRGRTIRALPVDIDHADFAGMPYTMVDGKPVFSGVPSYLPPEGQKQVNNVILARMKRDGYDLEHAKLIPELGMAIIRRKH